MKKIKYILLFLIAFGLASCSVEAPFDGPQETSEGMLRKSALDVDLSVIDNTRATVSQDILDNVEVIIKKAGTDQVQVESFLYKNMPEVVTLEQGKYIVTTSYGDDVEAEFESPYFYGESKEFEIEANKITSDIGTISCNLENVKVTINFHNSLADDLDDDTYVEVKVNSSKSLNFYKDENRAGYFQHQGVCTLAATYHGKIDGVQMHETKTLNQVEKGNHYNVTFSKHIYSGDSTNGSLDGSVSVNASVTVVNLNENVVIVDDEPFGEDELDYPTEGEDPSTGDDSGKDQPTEPGTPDTPQGGGPILTLNREESTITSLESVVDKDSHVVFDITSSTGLTKFRVDIESEQLHLEDIQIEEGYIDLIEPGDYLETYQGMNFIPEDKDSLKGAKEAKFDITSFMGLLCKLGPCEHTFILTIGDETGTNIYKVVLTVE